MFTFLSYKLNDTTPAYGGKTGFTSKPKSSIKNGDSANTSLWKFPNHLGTHIDFPYHFYDEGQTLNHLEEKWIFKKDEIQILFIDLLEDNLLIKPEHVKNKKINKEAKLVLIKTDFGKFRQKERYWKYNPGLDIEMANWLKNKYENIKIFGIDTISVSSYQNRKIGHKVHKILLNPKKPVLLIEDMDLSKISEKTIFKNIFIGPLRVENSDGVPCTILAEIK